MADRLFPAQTTVDNGTAEEAGSETATQHLVKRLPLSRATDTVAAVVAGLFGRSFDSVEAVYVVDDQGCVAGGDAIVVEASDPCQGKYALRRYWPTIRCELKNEPFKAMAERITSAKASGR